MVARQFIGFGIVGTAGFLVSAGWLQLALFLGFAPALAWFAAYLPAASFTYLVNRNLTFGVKHPPNFREWLAFLTTNLAGAALNYLTYLALFSLGFMPFWGLAAGSIMGLVANFILSRKLVFR